MKKDSNYRADESATVRVKNKSKSKAPWIAPRMSSLPNTADLIAELDTTFEVMASSPTKSPIKSPTKSKSKAKAKAKAPRIEPRMSSLPNTADLLAELDTTFEGSFQGMAKSPIKSPKKEPTEATISRLKRSESKGDILNTKNRKKKAKSKDDQLSRVIRSDSKELLVPPGPTNQNTLDRNLSEKKTPWDSSSQPENSSASSTPAASSFMSFRFDKIMKTWDMDKLKQKENVCSLISLILQITLFTSSVLVAIVTFKHLKYADPEDIFTCALYKKRDAPKSPACFSIETIFFISSLGAMLILFNLLGILFFKLKRTRTLYVIGISIGLFCGFLTLVAASLYEAGLKVSLTLEPPVSQTDNSTSTDVPSMDTGEWSSILDSIRNAGDIDIDKVYQGKALAWFTAIGWILFAGIEYYESLSYLSQSEYDVFIEEYS